MLPLFLLQLVLQILGRLLCICPQTCPNATTKKSPPHLHKSPDTDAKTLKSDNSYTPLDTDHNDLIQQAASRQPILSLNGSNIDRLHVLEKWFSRVELQLVLVKKSVGQIVRNAETRKQEGAAIMLVKKEWQQVARVLDRFFVIMYTVTIVVSIVVLFPKPLFLRVMPE